MSEKVKCPKCKRLVGVEDGLIVKHRTGRSPRHLVAKRDGTHRKINSTVKKEIKPVCKGTNCQA